MRVDVYWNEPQSGGYPETFLSVLVHGVLEGEYAPDVHEGFFDGREWWSVRPREEDPSAFRTIKMMDWAYMPALPR